MVEVDSCLIPKLGSCILGDDMVLGNSFADGTYQMLVAPPKKVHKCFSHMKTLELEIVQGFFFYSHYAFRYIFVKLDFANSVAFF